MKKELELSEKENSKAHSPNVIDSTEVFHFHVETDDTKHPRVDQKNYYACNNVSHWEQGRIPYWSENGLRNEHGFLW